MKHFFIQKFNIPYKKIKDIEFNIQDKKILNNHMIFGKEFAKTEKSLIDLSLFLP